MPHLHQVRNRLATSGVIFIYFFRWNEAQQTLLQTLTRPHCLTSRGIRQHQRADAAGRPDADSAWDGGTAAESSEVLETEPDVGSRVWRSSTAAPWTRVFLRREWCLARKDSTMEFFHTISNGVRNLLLFQLTLKSLQESQVVTCGI